MFFHLKSQPVMQAPAQADEQCADLEVVSLLLNNTLKGPAEMWEDLVRKRKLGYSALVRNLWNILVAAPNLVEEVVDALTDERLIKYAGVLPFEFFEAVAVFEKDPPHGALRALAAISEAIDLSLANIPRFKGRTLMVMDGSMRGAPLKLGCYVAAVMAKTNVAEVIVVGEDSKVVSLDWRESTISVSRRLQSLCVAGGAKFNRLFQRANRSYDRVVILSNQQAWEAIQAPFAEWKQRINGSPKVYSFDLGDSGVLRFPQPDVHCFAGWSEEALETMQLLESE